MKVLHVIPSLSPARGGPGAVVLQMKAALEARGVIIHIASTDDDGPHARLPHAPSDGTNYWFPRQTSFYSFSWPMTTWLGRHLRDYDAAHIHALFSYPSEVAAALARRAGVPYLIRPLGTLSPWGLASRHPRRKQALLALFGKRMLRGAAAVQATSEQERLDVLAACPGCRAVVIPNPVAMPDAIPVRPGPGKPSVILFLSRIDPVKGLETLLGAFDRLVAHDADLRLVIAGDGEPAYVARVRGMAASLAARDRVRFTGHADGGQKRLLFAAADLFVLPSYSESFGLAVAEAMAHGVPVLISPNVGIHQEVTDASAGRAAACTVDAVAQAMREMLDDPEGLACMGENGQRLVRERYSPGLVARLLVAEYEAAVGAKS